MECSAVGGSVDVDDVGGEGVGQVEGDAGWGE